MCICSVYLNKHLYFPRLCRKYYFTFYNLCFTHTCTQKRHKEGLLTLQIECYICTDTQIFSQCIQPQEQHNTHIYNIILLHLKAHNWIHSQPDTMHTLSSTSYSVGVNPCKIHITPHTDPWGGSAWVKVTHVGLKFKQYNYALGY